MGDEPKVVCEPTKKPWESKTNWIALIMAILAFFPQAQQIVRDNTELTMIIGPLVFMIMRLISHGKISIS